MSGSKGETFCKRESARKDANCRKRRKPRNHFHNCSNQTRTRLGDKTAYPTHLVGPAKFQEFYELLNSKLSRWNTKYILKQSFSFTSDMCWTHCCWTVVSLMSARTCWLQVPHRTLYSIIRDMCDCLVSRIHPTPRMPLAYMRISPIRLDLFSTAFTLLAFFKQSGESSPDNWAWALSPGFAIEICDGVDFFDHFFLCVTVCSEEAPYVFVNERRYCLEFRAPAVVHRWEVYKGKRAAWKLGLYNIYSEFVHTYTSCYLFGVEVGI